MALIVRGASNQEIARELYLTENTIKSKIRTSYAKIGVCTRAQAVAWGIEHGFPTTPALRAADPRHALKGRSAHFVDRDLREPARP